MWDKYRMSFYISKQLGKNIFSQNLKTVLTI